MELDYRIFEAPPAERLDIALAKLLKSSRSYAKYLISNGYVQLNGKPVEKASIKLSGTEIISVVIPLPKPVPVEPENIPLTILYEDDSLVVIDKPPNLVAHPTASVRKGTVINALMGRIPLAKEKYFNPNEDDYRPGIVHRLDKDTSGVMVVAKNQKAHHHLANSFKQRLTEKEYFAIAVGDIPDNVEVDAPIGRNLNNGFKMMVGGSNPKSANTYFQVIARAKHYSLGTLSLIKVKPHTGRTHQIRVHLLHLGTPIWGDDLYGLPSAIMPRQALHAFRLTLPHPEDNVAITFKAEIPIDITKAWLEIGGQWPQDSDM